MKYYRQPQASSPSQHIVFIDCFSSQKVPAAEKVFLLEPGVRG